MTTLAERIKQERKGRGLTQNQLGNLIGVSKSSVSQWESGLTKRMDGTNMVSLAKALGVNSYWLATGKGDKNAKESPDIISGEINTEIFLKSDHFRMIPVIGSATLNDKGNWTELQYSENLNGKGIVYPSQDCKAYMVCCVGDMLSPRIKDGEFILVEPSSEPQSGDEVFVKTVDGRVMVKILLYIRDGKVFLLSVNENSQPQSFFLNEIENIHLITGIARKSLLVTL